MPDFDQNPEATIASDQDGQIDALCDRFEQESKTRSPRLEDFLASNRRRALLERLQVELEMKRARGVELTNEPTLSDFSSMSTS